MKQEEQKIYSAVDIANKFISIFLERKDPPSHKKLQKLVYLAYGFTLFFEGKKLISEEFEAWQHGPVCRELYNMIKSRDYNNYDPYKITKQLEQGTKDLTEKDNKILDYIADYIVRSFGSWSANDLEKLTHMEGSAWDKISKLQHDEICLRDEDIKCEIQTIIDKLKQK